MKQRAHAWTALRALKLIDDTAVAPELTRLLCFYLSDVWEGAWLPDTLIVDMSYGHTYKMDSDSEMLGRDISKEEWLKTNHKELSAKLKGKRLCLGYIKDEPELEKPYRAHPDKGGHLPNRVIALSQSVSDMLKMSDYPLAFYAKKKLPTAYMNDLSDQSVKDLSISPNFSARQIAITFFMLSHYITDAHMPLHCDFRDYGGEKDKTRRLPPTLHPSIEEAWEKHFPEKEVLALHKYSGHSLDTVVKALPKNSIIKIDTLKDYALDSKIPDITQDEWQEMVYVCRASYAVSRRWIRTPYKNAVELIKAIGAEEFEKVTNYIFRDTVQSIAAVWLKAWKKFVD